MNADNNRDWQRFAAPFGFVVQCPEMAADRHEDAQLTLTGEHQTIVAGVSHSGIGIGGHHDACGDIWRRVYVIVREQRHFRQVDFVTEAYDFLHRGFAAFDGRNRFALSCAEFTCKLLRPALERERHEFAACLDIDDNRRLAALDALTNQQGKTLRSFELCQQRCDLVTRRDRFSDARDFLRMFGVCFSDETSQVFGHEGGDPRIDSLYEYEIEQVHRRTNYNLSCSNLNVLGVFKTKVRI